jgi:23S rRNA pseudouridine2605 synthase
MPEAERIQKLLANAGYGARREIEGWIRQGRIRVNGKVAGLGDRITTNDRVSLHGKLLRLESRTGTDLKIIAFNKPAGVVCSHQDREGRATVFEKLPELKQGRWVNIGRLDINTTGLMLFTNNGTLANRLMHPSSNIEREYAVRVFGTATTQQLQTLQQGVELKDGVAAFSSIIDKGGEGTNHWYQIVVNEGRNREVRRLWESQGLKVSRLIRVRYGPYQLPRNKRTGLCWELSQREIDELLQAAGLDPVLASGRGAGRKVKPGHKRTFKPGAKHTGKSRFRPPEKSGLKARHKSARMHRGKPAHKTGN